MRINNVINAFLQVARPEKCRLIADFNVFSLFSAIAIKAGLSSRLRASRSIASSFVMTPLLFSSGAELHQVSNAASAARFGRQFPAVLDSLEQFRHRHAKRMRDDQQRIEPRYALPALQQSHRCAMQPASFRKIFLRCSLLLAQFPHAPSECFEDLLHWRSLTINSPFVQQRALFH